MPGNHLTYFFIFSPQIRQTLDAGIPPNSWLTWKIKETSTSSDLVLPKNHAGQNYDINALYADQQFILYQVLRKIHEWLYCDDLSNFQPLRCTIIGQGGSGKSVLLNTITTVLRRLFQLNDVVRVACPTGTAAFNANGETLHRLTLQGIGSEYLPNTLSDTKQNILRGRFKHLLCLVIDERSLLTSKLLGSTSQIISETIFDGSNINDLWGGLPVLILSGDDYQLPGTGEGAFQAMHSTKGSKMTQKGRDVFLQCSDIVYKLSTSRRINDSQQHDKDLLNRLRTGDNILDIDLQKLQSLHLNNICNRHGPTTIANIEKDAIFLFYTNEKRVKHNLQRLVAMNSKSNPTAIIKCTGSGKKGKSIACHFQEESPKTTLLCLGATVSLQGCNFQPLWGLHNGACGTVQEIIYTNNESPNTGHLPSYVVVRFPQYIGPAWDVNNPQVGTLIVRVSSASPLNNQHIFFPCN